MSTDKFILTVDEDEFTIGDLEDFETVAGVSFVSALKHTVVKDDEGKTVFDAEGRPEKEVNLSPKALKALIWISKRRTDPSFTVDDARNVKVSAIEMAESDNGSDPKETSG